MATTCWWSGRRRRGRARLWWRWCTASETTLKRFYPEGNVVRLQPANLEMEPIYVPAAQVAIQGRVLGVLRKYR